MDYTTNCSRDEDLNTKDESFGLIDYLEVIVKHKRLILRGTLAALVVSMSVSILLPNWYQSTARILPPQQDSGLLGLMMGQAGGGMASFAGDLLGKGSPADLYVGILSSEAVSDLIIDRFKLTEVYDLPVPLLNGMTRIDTYKILDKNVNIAAGKKDGIISITVEDKDPKRAAGIANAYVEELGKLTNALNITGARQDNSYIEKQLSKAKADLTKAEEDLKSFQSRNQAVDISEQAKGTIKGVAELTAQLAAENVKLATLRHSLTDASQEVRSQKAIISGISSQIARFEGTHKGGAIPSVGSVPALGQEYVRLMREFKTQEALVELLTKQFEINKFTQAKDNENIQIIQKAQAADKKSKPRRAIIVLLTTFVAFAGTTFFAYVIDMFSSLPEQQRQSWRNLLSRLKA